MAIGQLTLRKPTVQTGFSLARLPGWLTWGAVIGLVQIFAIGTVGPLGVSTAYPQLVGWAGEQLAPGFAQQPYLKEIGASIGWEVMLVLGLFLGALLSAGLRKWQHQRDPALRSAPVCVAGFEGGRTRRYLRAFVGGFLFIFGARLAGGCTTGHILSGVAQMALSGLLFAAATFAGGMLFAWLFFREARGGQLVGGN